MIEGKGFILGGLPVWVKVSCGYDSFSGEHWSEVDSIYWLKRDGTKGKAIPDHLHDKAESFDYGFGQLIEDVGDDYRHRNSVL